MPNINKPTDINNIWAATGDVVAPAADYVSNGWEAIIPPREYFNWLDNRQDRFNAHINQHGIPVWDANTEYQANLSYSKGSNGTIYRALTTNSNVNPVGDTTGAWGVAFAASGGVARFLSSGTFVVPTGKTTIYITAVAGGGSGGSGAGSAGGTNRIGVGGGGGGAGQFLVKAPYTVTPGSSIAITVGEGGAGPSSSNLNGTVGDNGGNTVIGSLVTLSGGQGGSRGLNVLNASGGGVLGGAGYPNGGGSTDVTGTLPDDSGGSGGQGGDGASSIMGGGGGGGRGTLASGVNGLAANGYGAGGGGGGGCYRTGGGNVGGRGGNGSSGIVIIEWV